MNGPFDILILSDGKPGHENQSYGLGEAIGRLRPVRISVIGLAGMKSPFARLRKALRGLKGNPAPRLLLGAGHAVHSSLLSLAIKTGAPCVVMMKPTLPATLFDLCLVPEHDLAKRQPPENVVPTLGALNRVPPPNIGSRSGGLILLGGPSSSHGWDGEAVTSALEAITAAAPSRAWKITDSRRTPGGALARIAARIPALASYPHAETGRDWLPHRLAEAEEAWVTEDSVSMIYEALSSGARVGLLPAPALKKAGRVAKGIARLADEGFVTPFARWTPSAGLAAPPRVLREADRCASIVMERLFS